MPNNQADCKKNLTLNAYQKKAFKTAMPNAKTFAYMILGLTSEAGEIASLLKKAIRDLDPTFATSNDPSKWSPELKDKLVKEMGDSLWYISSLAKLLGISLEKVAKINLDKLNSRYSRGKIGGSGDDR